MNSKTLPVVSFNSVYINNVNSKVQHVNNANDYCQDPFLLWRWPHHVTLFNDERMTYKNKIDTRKQRQIRKHFFALYKFKEDGKEIHQYSSSTSPYLCDIQAIGDNNLPSDIFHQDDSLLLKLVPFHVKKKNYRFVCEDHLEEIYHEILIAYFLNKLVYSHRHVLSIHFMILIDWFIVRGETLLPFNSPLLTTTTTKETTPFFNMFDDRQRLYQAIILEKADITLKEYLRKNPMLNVLKTVLFEIFQAMEVTWFTNEHIHHDLKLDNIMMKKMDCCYSQMKDKNFLYRRVNCDKHWYKLDKDVIRNHIAKIIDFGRNRMYIPSTPYSYEEKQPDILLELYCFDHCGYSIRDVANRHIDVYNLLLSILGLSHEVYWSNFLMDERSDEFFQFCNDIIPFDVMNNFIDNMGVGHPLYFDRPDNKKIDARSFISYKSHLKDIFWKTGNFIFKNYPNDQTTVTTVLDHSFFDEFKQISLTEDDHLQSVVVSFPTNMNDEEKEEDFIHVKCWSCGRVQCTSKMCYDFLTIYDGKTVLR
jgi:hypothetical protein